eukprot:GHVQ01015264.1.p1 GENE.GHVQ01015264.1~~GHVQ01015264.1.p1  ORF type:complete len:124 (+),score=21.72 GHVQ01015264.1:322-693(+)
MSACSMYASCMLHAMLYAYVHMSLLADVRSIILHWLCMFVYVLISSPRMYVERDIQDHGNKRQQNNRKEQKHEGTNKHRIGRRRTDIQRRTGLARECPSLMYLYKWDVLVQVDTSVSITVCLS